MADNINEIDDIKKGSEEKDYKKYAEKLNLEYVELKGYPISPDVLKIISREDAQNFQVISYLKVGNKVKIATPDPQLDKFQEFLFSLKNMTKYDFIIAITSPTNIKSTLDLYNNIKIDSELKRGSDKIDITEEEINRFSQSIKSLKDLQEELKKVPTTFLLELILTGALKTEASDVHIEVEEKEVIIRYRIDGVLHPILSIDSAVSKSIISRIKFLCKLKLDVNKLPQDGKFFITHAGKRVDIRVSTLPEVFGESVVLRLLNKDVSFAKVTELGLSEEQLKLVKDAYSKTHGLMFVVGPTGSGKTTTLYAFLEQLNKPGVKIITLEDPVEYNLPGTIQSQINAETNYTFAVGLRSILRQDPDIVLIGEIRDLETAEMAVQASLTGHLVLTTLHTNDAPSVVHRLLDIGVRPFLIVDAINIIIAQRLVRKVCPKCKDSYVPEEFMKKEIERIIPNADLSKLVRGKGCDYCHQTGFKGRVGIFEILTMNDELKELIIQIASLEKIKEAAFKNGMIAMEKDGMIKALQGITTPEEVWRVIKD